MVAGTTRSAVRWRRGHFFGQHAARCGGLPGDGKHGGTSWQRRRSQWGLCGKFRALFFFLPAPNFLSALALSHPDHMMDGNDNDTQALWLLSREAFCRMRATSLEVLSSPVIFALLLLLLLPLLLISNALLSFGTSGGAIFTQGEPSVSLRNSTLTGNSLSHSCNGGDHSS